MALVEDIAQRRTGILAAERGGDHHQGVVGDHDVGVAGLARRPLDEAFAVVGAGRIDALAAPVGQPERAAMAEQLDQPGGEIAADHVAVAAGERPARHQPQRHALDRHPARAPRPAPAGRILHVEKAEVVLAALAHHHLLGLDLGLRVEPVELLVDLALQVLGEGAEPHRALVAPRPQAGRRDVAQGLADAGAGLG